MTKTLISDKQLIGIINVALQKDWQHKDHYCLVSELKRVSLPERNWEVTMSTMGGEDFRYVAECDALKEQVLGVLVTKYDVLWE